MEDGYDAMATLVQAIAAGLMRRGGEGIEPSLARLAEQDFSADAYRRPEARRLDACSYLPEAVASTLSLDSTLAAALAGAEDALQWRQNPNYSDAAMGQPGYMERYAYAEIVGPDGPFPGNDFLLGLMILGPDLHYPDHVHPAPELYWLLTGPSHWRRGPEPFTQREAGDTLWHRPDEPHATRTGSEPLLAVWIWTRDVGERARLVAEGS